MGPSEDRACQAGPLSVRGPRDTPHLVKAAARKRGERILRMARGTCGCSWPPAQRRVPAGDATALLSLKVAVVPASLFLLGLWERLRPAARPLTGAPRAREPGGLDRLGRNLGLFGLNSSCRPRGAAGHGLGRERSLGLRPAWLSGWAGLAFDILLLDFWLYWWHRANH